MKPIHLSSHACRKLEELEQIPLQYFKELAHQGLDMSTQASASISYHIYDRLLLSEDSREGPRAFTEKRKPQWKGR